MSIAIDIIEETIQKLAHDANELAVTNPLGWHNTRADHIVGTQIQVLKDVQDCIMKAEAKALEGS